jgi:molybdopterin-guanine dinucleotide biosynthesis protein A
MTKPVGLLLLTGGEGRRLGVAKHGQPHPEGGTWAGHLVGVFQQAFPEGIIQILGEPVPDHPELVCLLDPRQGPARALAGWAASGPPPALRWWVLACDQVRWSAPRLRFWSQRATEADPEGMAWVLADHGGRIQFLGGFLGGELVPAVARASGRSLHALMEALPTVILPATGPEWLDVDTPEDLATWRG